MITAHILSDIHLEHFIDPRMAIKYLEYMRPVETADVLILAGDIVSLNKPETLLYFDEFKKWAIEVIYIPGNHEFYNMNPLFDGEGSLSVLESEGIRVLGPNNLHSFTYQDQKFVGTTCWYPDTPNIREKLMHWSDKAYIKAFFTWWEKHQLEERKMLWNEVDENTIVITHMLPTWECVSPKFANDAYNVLYVSDMQDLVDEKNPKMWIHGHSHENLDVTINKTRFFRNPIGYPGLTQTQSATISTLEL